PSRKASTTPWNHASLNHSTLFETGSYLTIIPEMIDTKIWIYDRLAVRIAKERCGDKIFVSIFYIKD
ncbi:MAG: hypothetical protein K2X10_07150, partial [Hyphomicrobiales bacterium]|nr:hypothetical protein [Hyphomicrobiales bacterium]